MTEAESPNDQLAEQSVLGAMMISAKAIGTVAGILTAEDFFMPSHRDIYTSILDVANAGGTVDPITVGDALEKSGKRIQRTYLLTLMQQVPTAVNAEDHAKIVAEKAQLRGMAELGTRLKQLALVP